MNTVYQEATQYTSVRDSEWIAQEYRNESYKIAECLAKLNESKEHIDYLHELTKDNADVAFDLENAITKLGIALATCITYCKKYQDEADDKDEKEEEE